MGEKNPTAEEIWGVLSKVNVNEHTQDRGGLTYLSWAWAYGIMMDHFPSFTIEWHKQPDSNGDVRDVNMYEGGSASVSCTVTIGDVSKQMWLPVMDYRHKAIANPDARSISDAKMRCLTKCFSLFGLGNYIYQNEELPPNIEPTKEKPKAKKKAAPKKAAAKAAKKEPAPHPKQPVKDLVTAVTELDGSGWVPEDDLKEQIKNAVKNQDVEESIRLTELVNKTAQVALKLHDEKEESNDG